MMPLATLVCLLMAMPLLGTLVSGAWWVPAAVLMAVMAAISALYRLTGWNTLPVPFLQLSAVLLLVTPLFAWHTAPLGLLPSPAAVEYLVLAFDQGMGAISTGVPPVPASSGIMLIIAMALAVVMMTADFLAATARSPGMVGGLLLTLMVMPLIVDDGGVGWGAAASCAAGFLLLLAVDAWVRGREWGVRVPDGHDSSARVLSGLRRVGAVSAASAAAILVALAVPMSVPSLRSDILYTMAEGTYVGAGGDVITTTHPLVSLRRELASSSDRTVLTYVTDAEDPDYLRMFLLDEFDGENWTMTPMDASGDHLVEDELPLPTGWPEESGDATATTRISMDSDSPSVDFLPVPYWARSVDVSGEWYADPDSLMVFTTDSPPTGLSFTVETADRAPSPEALAEAGSPRSLNGGFESLPRDLDPQVQVLTDAVTEGSPTPYERALAIQDHFTQGSFSYDLSPPPIPEGADPLAYFLLEDQVGYCEQYAGAMAVMARQAGIPARVAVGYTAGERMADGRWSVSVGDAHAWPELYFEGTGWVRFEPTPASSQGQGSASVPDYTAGGNSQGTTPTDPLEPDDPRTERPEEAPSPDEEPSASDEESDAPAEEPGDAAAASDDGQAPGPVAMWLPAAGAALGALLLLALPALVRALVRWSRTAALTGAAGASAHTAWHELRDTWLDLGGTWVLAESPRTTAERLSVSGPVSADARASLWRLALAEEAARYAPEPAAAEWPRQDLRTARAGLAAVVGRGARVRAVLLPRSLAPWRRPRPAAGATTVTV